NDFGNCEFDRWNVLAAQFGFQFNKDSKNRVQNDQYEQGLIEVPDAHPIFRTARKLYLKEISTIKLSGRAEPVLKMGDDVVMAKVKFGKGTVFAIGDPWLYNEYVDGRKMKGIYDNHQAAVELSGWLLSQSKK
ncbi:MAG TPA: hypothetical protein PKM58_08905, partial [Pyrinomonadaceae bacterium]|nr:hypothetical protein [Pyrinomonadaceae bacterium]